MGGFNGQRVVFQGVVQEGCRLGLRADKTRELAAHQITSGPVRALCKMVHRRDLT